MGNYLTIKNLEGVQDDLRKVYHKHLKINQNQFQNDFGGLNSFEDCFTQNSNGDFELKTGVLDRNFYNIEFIRDVYTVIVSH